MTNSDQPNEINVISDVASRTAEQTRNAFNLFLKYLIAREEPENKPELVRTLDVDDNLYSRKKDAWMEKLKMRYPPLATSGIWIGFLHLTLITTHGRVCTILGSFL